MKTTDDAPPEIRRELEEDSRRSRAALRAIEPKLRGLDEELRAAGYEPPSQTDLAAILRGEMAKIREDPRP